MRDPAQPSWAAPASAAEVDAAVGRLAAAVPAPDAGAAAAAAARYDALAKPVGSLGRLEAVGARLAGLRGDPVPPVPAAPVVLVAAADHGVVGGGVTMWDASVTTAMVELCRAGRAAVNALAATVGARVEILDVGLAHHPASDDLRRAGPGGNVTAALHRAPVRRGTADLSEGPAMSRAEAGRALLTGAGLAVALMDDGADLIVTGDLGVGNTTPSACLVAAFTGADPGALVGRGAGADDAALARKRGIVTRAAARGATTRGDALGVLAECGGLEHAALAGAVLAAAARRVPVLLDGVASVAAALVADALAPAATGACFAGHLSAEPAAGAGLEYLGLDPLLDLSLRLGEGTGGVLGVPLLQAAATALSQMALLEDVTGATPRRGTSLDGQACSGRRCG